MLNRQDIQSKLKSLVWLEGATRKSLAKSDIKAILNQIMPAIILDREKTAKGLLWWRSIAAAELIAIMAAVVYYGLA